MLIAVEPDVELVDWTLCTGQMVGPDVRDSDTLSVTLSAAPKGIIGQLVGAMSCKLSVTVGVTGPADSVI